MRLLKACWTGLCLLLLCQSCWLEATRDSEEAVKCESIIEATLGEEANFSCNFLLPMDVFQVTWQKINGSSFQNIATYSQIRGLRLIGSFRRKARFTRAALNTSAFTLQNVTFEDVSCYKCIFNVFPRGSFSSQDLCLKIRKSGITNKPEVKMLDMGSPNTRGIQKRIGVMVVFIGVVLAALIILIMWLINRKRRKLQKQRAHSTPEKEKVLQQDGSEQSKHLKVQDSAYINEEDVLHDLPSHRHEAHQPVVAGPSFQPFLNMGVMFPFFQSPGTSPDSYSFSNMMRQTPGSSLRKRQLNPRRNLEENKGRGTWKRNKRLVFSEEAGSQHSTSHNIPQRELTELSNDELGCTLIKNNSETEACGESELCPDMATPWPSTGEQSAHRSPVDTIPEETEGFMQVGNPS